MKEALGVLFSLVAIAIGLGTIIVLVGNAELVIGLIALTFGITAIIWTIRARNALSHGSLLQQYATVFAVCLAFVIFFSLWRTADRLFFLRERLGEFIVYPEYFFITLAYLSFVFAAYYIRLMGKEFGFLADAKEIMGKLGKKKRR